MDRHTDYALLTASLQLLNIALDDGSSVEAPNLSYMHLSRISLASLEKSAEEKAKEEKFNSDIDTLATALRDIWSSISEVGAGQVGKLDAREAIEMLRNRLLYTVRTKPALRKRIFDVPGKGSERKLSGYEGTGKQRNFMKGFLAKGKKT